MRLLDSEVDQKMWNLVSKCNFLFLTPWKICFWINGKFEIYFFWKWTWKCSQSPKTNTFELLGLCSWNFWNFLFSMRLSNGEYFKDFKIFDLTWIWWISLEWPSILKMWTCDLQVKLRNSFSCLNCFSLRNKFQSFGTQITLIYKLQILIGFLFVYSFIFFNFDHI